MPCWWPIRRARVANRSKRMAGGGSVPTCLWVTRGKLTALRIETTCTAPPRCYTFWVFASLTRTRGRQMNVQVNLDEFGSPNRPTVPASAPRAPLRSQQAAAHPVRRPGCASRPSMARLLANRSSCASTVAGKPGRTLTRVLPGVFCLFERQGENSERALTYFLLQVGQIGTIGQPRPLDADEFRLTFLCRKRMSRRSISTCSPM